MFTSGSTGLPKAVGVRHTDVTALAADRNWDDGAADAVLMHSAYVFDASTFEIWAPLLNGGRVVVAPEGTLQPSVLRDLVARYGVTAAFLTTALFNVLAETDAGALGLLRLAATGGEAAAPGVLQRLATAHPDTVVLHVYGPTETTTFATTHRVRPDDAPGGPAPIGRALDGMRTYVLDAALRPVPAGAEGELASRAPVSPADTWDGPASPPPGSSPIRSRAQGHVCTAPGTSCAGLPTAPCTTRPGRTSRSNCAATASNPPRSRRCSAPTRPWAPPAYGSGRTCQATGSSPPTSSRRPDTPRNPVRSRRTSHVTCPRTWCRPSSSWSTHCH